MTSSKITALIQPPDKGGRVDVYADGEYLMSVSEDAAVEAGLKIGEILDEERLKWIEFTKILAICEKKAYNILYYGNQSTEKMREKLKKRGFSEEVIDACIDKLTSLGYLDDEAYARALAEDLARARLYGPRRIIQELYVHGIKGELAHTAVDGLDVDWAENIVKLANGRLRRKIADKSDFQKQVQAIMRAGYSYEQVKSTLSFESEEIFE